MASDLYHFHRVVVHTIHLNENEDPDLCVAEPIHRWQQTAKGKFVMENSSNVCWDRTLDMSSFGFVYKILAEFESKKLTEYYLKFTNN